jgi:uncharacterized protein (TIGR02646 family)
MIEIRRSVAAPDVLRTKGRQLRDEHIARQAKGDANFDFDRDVYGDATVKSSLRIAQYDKCAFCESKVTHVAFGDIEHFRPKAAFRTTSHDALTRPGYYWLAYEWTNLLFACELCNRRHKGNLFPLVDEAKRVRSHTADAVNESPLFIDPAAEDPTRHIGFRGEYPYPIGGSPRGDATVRALGLDRAELVERRRERLQKLRLLRLAAGQLRRKRDRRSKALAQEIEEELQRCLEDGAEFAAAARWVMAPVTRSQRKLGTPRRRLRTAK